MKLIIGLGNPGDDYVATRHNLGFQLLDDLAHHYAIDKSQWENSKVFKSIFCKAEINGQQLILAKPQTYMNNSGLGVKALMEQFEVALEDIIVVHDELDLKLGQIKIRQGGSAAGHRGVESILNELGADNFIRVRLGIAPEEHSVDVDKFVVAPFDRHEKSKIKHMLKRAIQAVDTLLNKGLADAQNQYN